MSLQAVNRSVRTQARSSAALTGLVFLVLIYVGRVQELIPGLMEIRLGKIMVGLTLLLYVLSPERGGMAVFRFMQTRWISLMFILAAVSVPFSVWPRGSLEFFSDFAKTVLFFLLTVKSVMDERGVRRLFWALAWSVLLLALFTAVPEAETSRIAASRTYNPNDIAMVFVIAFPILYFMADVCGGFRRLFLQGTILVVLYALIRTGSRGGFLAFLFTTFVLVFGGSSRGRIKRIAVAAIAATLFAVAAPPVYWQRMSTLVNIESDYNLTDAEGRTQIWKRGARMMTEHPVLGVGVGAFPFAEGLSEGRIVPGRKWSAAHNTFVQVGSEIGVPGLVAFLALLLGSLSGLGRLRRKWMLDPAFAGQVWMADGLRLGLCAYMVAGFFLSAAYMPIVYFLFAMCALLTKIDLRREAPLP